VMMGRQKRDQAKLFYEFHLDDRIPKTHLLRRIDVFVTAALADLHKDWSPTLEKPESFATRPPRKRTSLKRPLYPFFADKISTQNCRHRSPGSLRNKPGEERSRLFCHALCRSPCASRAHRLFSS